MEGIVSPAADQRTAAQADNDETDRKTTIELLTFESLNRRLSSMPDYNSPSPRSRRWSRIGLLTVLLSYAAALVVPRLSFTGGTQLTLLLAALVIEIAGLAINMWFTRGELTSLFRPLEDLSRNLDHDFQHHFKLRGWLTAQPMERLEQYASMAAYRRERYTQTLPMLAGSIPTRGIIPVLIAVYFQARQLLDGRHLSWVDWLFGFALFLFYVLAWTSSISKSRLEAMDLHLQSALAEATKNRPPAEAAE